MDKLFLDTSFLVAYYNVDDENHSRAEALMRRIIKDTYPVVISDYIFGECCTVLLVRLKDLKKTVLICELLKDTDLLKVDDFCFTHAFELFKEQKGTKLSFTDCSTLALMQMNSIKKIITFDEDFRKIKWIDVGI